MCCWGLNVKSHRSDHIRIFSKWELEHFWYLGQCFSLNINDDLKNHVSVVNADIVNDSPEGLSVEKLSVPDGMVGKVCGIALEFWSLWISLVIWLMWRL